MTDQSQNTLDRNDPAIDPESPQDESVQSQQNQGRPQGQPDTQFEQNQQSGGNTFTPDYEPEEKPEIQRPNPHATQGEDADVDTDGG
ncbi:hypothetical protein [Pseudomonas syringae]|uniref:hypothetical protein n=1 Tax=Pseudomonas syringae TaxID=317 RepID=UPI00067DE0C9|nr:hypothetical protein [Pseudomonas syringae]